MHFLFQIEVDEQDVDEWFRDLFGQLAGQVSCCQVFDVPCGGD